MTINQYDVELSRTLLTAQDMHVAMQSLLSGCITVVARQQGIHPAHLLSESSVLSASHSSPDSTLVLAASRPNLAQESTRLGDCHSARSAAAAALWSLGPFQAVSWMILGCCMPISCRRLLDAMLSRLKLKACMQADVLSRACSLREDLASKAPELA